MSFAGYTVAPKSFEGALLESRNYDSKPEIDGVKYFDITSTHRDRRQYPNPCDFVLPVYSNLPSVASTFRDPVLLSFPFTGSTTPIGSNFIQAYSVVGGQADVTLDATESSIDNFYVHSLLEISGESRRILAYSGATKIARIATAYAVSPLVGTGYITRRDNSYFASDVGIVGYNTATNTVTSLNLLDVNPSPLRDFYKGSYFTFTNGTHVGEMANVTSYTPISTLPAWEQPLMYGNNEKLIPGTETGFRFVPNPGYLYSVAFYGHVFDDTNPTRSVIVRVRVGEGVSGAILHQETISIATNAGPNAISFTLTGLGPYLYTLSYFTLSFQDISLSTTGFINLYGITTSSSLLSYNFSIYPKLTLSAYVDIPTVWEQPTANGINQYISTSSINGFAFSVPSTSNMTGVSITLSCFDVLSGNRTLRIALKSGGGITNPDIYTEDFAVSPSLVPSIRTFTFLGITPSMTASATYTLTVQDISGSNGYINMYGIVPTATYVAYNCSVYPKLSLTTDTPVGVGIYDQNQPISNFINDYVDIFFESGWSFVPTVSSTLSTVCIYLSAYESISPGRTYTLRVRQGTGLLGTVLYSTTGLIPNTSFPTNYIIPLPAGPYLTNGTGYTLTLQDMTAGGLGSGYINIIGITPPANTAFGINVYPRMELFPSLVPFTENHATPFAIVTVANTEYIYYYLSPLSAGPNYGLLNLIPNFKNYGAGANITFRIREGYGISGNILAEITQFCDTGVSSVSFNNNPMMYRAIGLSNYYTITISSDINGVDIHAGDSITYSFSSYGVTECASQLLPSTSNVAGVFRSGLVVPFTDTGSIFVPSSTQTFRSISLSYSSFDALAMTRDIEVQILDGNGLGNPVIYSETFSVPVSRYIATITLSASGALPTLLIGNFYTLVIKDVSLPSSGECEMYGIVPSATFVTDSLSLYPKTNIQGTEIISAVAFSQTSNPVITEPVNATYLQGYRFVPTISGTLTTLSLLVSCYSQILSRTLNYKIVSGGGVGGAVLVSGTATLSNTLNGTQQSIDLLVGAPALVSGSIYTLVIQDPNIVTDGNIFLYGVAPNGTYIAYNSAVVYPQLSVYDSIPAICNQQTSNPSLFTLVNPLSEMGFYIRSTFSGYLSNIVLPLFSYDVSGTRSLRVRIIEGSGLPTPFPVVVFDQTFPIVNSTVRQEYDLVPLPFSASLIATKLYTLLIQDVTAGGVASGSMYTYGISPVGYFIAYNSVIYPLLEIFTPAAIITIDPPKDLSKFLANNTDNVSFNVAAKENALTLNYNAITLGPSRMNYWQIGFKYLSIPNVMLRNGHGGRLNQYPYIYVQIYNEGFPGNSHIIRSNEPGSTLAIFPIPVDRYLYDIPESFFTLYNYTSPQIIRFRPDQDIRFRITFPDGTPLQFDTDDTLPPNLPNPFLQVHAELSLYLIPEYKNTE